MSTRKFIVCPTCGRDWHGTLPELARRVGIFMREVWFGGRGRIRLLKVYRVQDMAKGSMWMSQVRASTLALAKMLGFELSARTVDGVRREFDAHVGRRVVKAYGTAARKAWQKRGDGRQVGRIRRTRGAGMNLGGAVGTWDLNVDETEGAGQDLGGTVGSWT
jgi:hypothetical protein